MMKPVLPLRAVLRACAWLLLLLALPGHSASPVWKVEKNGTRLFIGGTLHMLTAQDYPLPQAFEAAYREAGRIVFETDMAKMNDPEFQQYMLRELSYGAGGNLRQVLEADTWDAVSAFFGARGLSMSSVENFRPGMVATMMTVIELQRLGVESEGVDAHFDRRASADGKAKGELESGAQQVAFIASLGAGQEDALLRYSLADIERLPRLWREMTRAWRSGDTAWLEDNIATEMRRDFPTTHQAILIDRNRDWMPQIEAMARSAQVELVLVGALHLVGAEGLLELLRERGYRVTQLD